MRRVSLLICIFECIGLLLAVCTVTKHEGDSGARVQCQNVSLNALLEQNSSNVIAIMVFNSNLREIPGRSFTRYSSSLQSLNIHKCRFRDIDASAFDGLASLKNLALPNNNISEVKLEWFKDTVYLTQLDLSYNRIEKLSPIIFTKMLLLKRLDIRENRLACFDYASLPGGIDKVYFQGNPLTFQCRGKLTLWMRDHGVSYKEAGTSSDETWLDNLLWLCATDDRDVAASELLLKQCLILSLFNQLRTSLTTTESYALKPIGECDYDRNQLTQCLVNPHRPTPNNGQAIVDLLLYLREATSS